MTRSGHQRGCEWHDRRLVDAVPKKTMNWKDAVEGFAIAAMCLLLCGTSLAQEEQPLPNLVCQTKENVWVRHTHTGLKSLARLASLRSVYRIEDMQLFEARANSKTETAFGKLTQVDSRADYVFTARTSLADEIIAITLFRDTLHGYVVFTNAAQASIDYIECTEMAKNSN